MRDHDQGRFDVFDFLPKEKQPFARAGFFLSRFLHDEVNTSIGEVRDPTTAARLVTSTDPQSDNSHFLLISQDIPLEQQGYYYLKGIADMLVGNAIDLDELRYPVLGSGEYGRLSKPLRDKALLTVQTTRSILQLEPLSAWSPRVQTKIDAVGIAGWREEAQAKATRIQNVFAHPEYSPVRELWEGFAASEERETAATPQGGNEAAA